MASKIILTSILFIIIGWVISSFSDDNDYDNGIVVGMLIFFVAIVGFIVGILMAIWID